MMEQGAGAIGADDEGTAGEVGREAGAEEAGGCGIEERHHAFAGELFIGALGEVEREKLRAEFGAGHAREFTRKVSGRRREKMSDSILPLAFRGPRDYFAGMSEDDFPKLDRKHFSVAELAQAEDEHYWWSKTPAERLAALELMRQSMYGYDPARTRLQRVFAVAPLGRRLSICS